MNLLQPFREADVPPCECGWCRKSRLRRSMTWIVRVCPRLTVLLAVVGAVVWSSIAIATCSHEKTLVEEHAQDIEKASEQHCVEQAFIFDDGAWHSCRQGARAEVKPANFGSRQVLICHCPE